MVVRCRTSAGPAGPSGKEGENAFSRDSSFLGSRGVSTSKEGGPRQKRPTFPMLVLLTSVVRICFFSISSFRFHRRVKIGFVSISSDVV